jgi:hypothetical protein
VDILKPTAAMCTAFIVWAMTVTPASAQISPGELSRAHADLEGMKNCLKCHDLGEGPSDAKCMDCHREIAALLSAQSGYHYRVNVEAKKECFECHSEHAGRDFALIHWPDGMNNFDHGMTGHELVGKHASLKCRDCHNPGLMARDPAQYGDQVHLSRTFLGLGAACRDCHADEHRGQLAGECSTCHSNDAWKPVPGFDHGKTAFALTGRHAGLSCGKCHKEIEEKEPSYPNDDSFVRFTGLTFANCTPCHQDAHEGRYGKRCATCHNTSGWHDIPTSAFDHSKTRFPLLGMHAGLPCKKCHAPGEKKAPLAHGACTDCHEDVHRGQFIARADGGACEACHTVDGFVPSLFTTGDHAGTRFALVGAHLAQPCFACHRMAKSDDGVEYRVFVLPDRRCEACHEDPHHAQFSSSRPPKHCGACHGVGGWKPVAFDHDRDSAYKLEGQHRRVACASCHVRVTTGGNTFVRYRPIDPSCKTCHGERGLKLGANRNTRKTGAL